MSFPTLEQIETVIFRMTRVAPRGDLVLADYSPRDLAIAVRDLFKGTSFEEVQCRCAVTPLRHRAALASKEQT